MGRKGSRRVRPGKGDGLSHLFDAAVFLIAGGLIAGGSAVLVWPLWKLATTDRILYTALVGIAILAFVSWRLFRRFLSRRTLRGRTREMDPRP